MQATSAPGPRAGRTLAPSLDFRSWEMSPSSRSAAWSSGTETKPQSTASTSTCGRTPSPPSSAPTGLGKTTTIETCEGYRRPDDGTVRVLGLDPVADAAALRPRIGVMLQSGGVYSGARADEMLRHMAKLHAHPWTWTP